MSVSQEEKATAGDNHHQFIAERRVTVWGLVANIGLTAGKVLAGLFCGSSAITADGLHSGSDLASDIAVLWGIQASKRPADECHHYGHSRYEAIVTLFIGLLLVAAALLVGLESLVSVGHRHEPIRGWLPFWMAIGSIVLKEALYWWTRSVGRRFHNPALIANAWHHRSDAFSSIAAAAGIGGALLGGPSWLFLDHLTAVVLAAFLVVIGVRICREAIFKLADRSPAPEIVRKMRDTIQTIPGVRGFHAFRARGSGAGRQIEMDVHVQVDPQLSVRQGHEIASLVEVRLRQVLPDITSTVVHIEPQTDPTASECLCSKQESRQS